VSAAELRQAAETLRKRAKAATPGPWGFTDSEAAASLVNLPDDGMVVLYDGDTPVALCADEFYENEPGEPAPFNDAQWISTMHPGVGLALAEWLLAQAHHVASRDCEVHCEYPDGCDETKSALTVARLINGGVS
jgi:hypothetical protein